MTGSVAKTLKRRKSRENCMGTSTASGSERQTARGDSAKSFAEEALRLSGKTEEEARRTGAMDKADEQVESMFAPQYQTANSPVHRAVWDRSLPLELFAAPPLPASAPCDPSMTKCLEIVRRRRLADDLLDTQGKLSKALFDELAAAGYWGML